MVSAQSTGCHVACAEHGSHGHGGHSLSAGGVRGGMGGGRIKLGPDIPAGSFLACIVHSAEGVWLDVGGVELRRARRRVRRDRGREWVKHVWGVPTKMQQTHRRLTTYSCFPCPHAGGREVRAGRSSHRPAPCALKQEPMRNNRYPEPSRAVTSGPIIPRRGLGKP